MEAARSTEKSVNINGHIVISKTTGFVINLLLWERRILRWKPFSAALRQNRNLVTIKIARLLNQMAN
jgi:hypothetical protein